MKNRVFEENGERDGLVESRQRVYKHWRRKAVSLTWPLKAVAVKGVRVAIKEAWHETPFAVQ